MKLIKNNLIWPIISLNLLLSGYLISDSIQKNLKENNKELFNVVALYSSKNSDHNGAFKEFQDELTNSLNEYCNFNDKELNLKIQRIELPDTIKLDLSTYDENVKFLKYDVQRSVDSIITDFAVKQGQIDRLILGFHSSKILSSIDEIVIETISPDGEKFYSKENIDLEQKIFQKIISLNPLAKKIFKQDGKIIYDGCSAGRGLNSIAKTLSDGYKVRVEAPTSDYVGNIIFDRSENDICLTSINNLALSGEILKFIDKETGNELYYADGFVFDVDKNIFIESDSISSLYSYLSETAIPEYEKMSEIFSYIEDQSVNIGHFYFVKKVKGSFKNLMVTKQINATNNFSNKEFKKLIQQNETLLTVIYSDFSPRQTKLKTENLTVEEERLMSKVEDVQGNYFIYEPSNLYDYLDSTKNISDLDSLVIKQYSKSNNLKREFKLLKNSNSPEFNEVILLDGNLKREFKVDTILYDDGTSSWIRPLIQYSSNIEDTNVVRIVFRQNYDEKSKINTVEVVFPIKYSSEFVDFANRHVILKNNNNGDWIDFEYCDDSNDKKIHSFNHWIESESIFFDGRLFTNIVKSNYSGYSSIYFKDETGKQLIKIIKNK